MGLKRRQITNLPGVPVSQADSVFGSPGCSPILACSSTICCYLAAMLPTSSQDWRENNKNRTERQECKYLNNFNQLGVFQRHNTMQ